MRIIDGAMQDFALTLDKLLDHAAKWHPDREVVTAGNDGVSSRIGYADLKRNALCVSAFLTSQNVKLGDHIATLCWNTHEHMECWYGIMGIGAICHTLNPRLKAEQLAWMIGQSHAKILFASGDLYDLAQQIVERLDFDCQIYLIDCPGTHSDKSSSARILKNELPNTASDTVWGHFDETTSCGLCFTSGTTGPPKGVTYTHRANFLHALRLLQASVSGITPADVVLPVVPMFHANAWGLPFSAPTVGAKLVFPGRHADGRRLASLIDSENVTIAVGVPTVWLGLMDYLDETGIELHTLKRIMVGGAPMQPALMKRIEDRGIELQTTWGMTELSPLGTATPPTDKRSAQSAGRVAIGLDLQLTDENANVLPQQRGKEGHLWVKGASVVERYFGQEETATQNGWFKTGDLAMIDDDGRLFITGRSKDLIKSGGEWINPVEIEAIISELPEVSLAAVIGKTHPKWGERPLLIVEFREGYSLNDESLKAALKGKIPSWWMPDSVVTLSAIPLAATGKIDKLRLQSQHA